MSEDTVLGQQATPRRWPRRLLIGLNIFVAVCLVATAATYGYLRYRFGQVDKLDFACNVLRNCGDDDPGEPMNVLLVGSDSRRNLSPEERRAFGSEAQVGGQRSDTILILHAEPGPRKASILSVPRDLAVRVAGSEQEGFQRINQAFERGPETLIATIRQSLGIEIDHYAQVDFNGFRGIVDAIGGVTVYFPSPARDRQTGLDIRTPGCVQLSGNQALSYVRSREYQYFEAGRWRLDGTGDLGRIQRQQDFIRRVMRKASRAGRNPVTLNSLIGTAVRNVTIDRSFSSKDIFRLGKRFRSLDPDAVEMLSLPTTEGKLGEAAVLRLEQPEADQVIDRFLGRLPPPEAGGQAPAIPPNTVRVRVLNGSGGGGQAGQVAQDLQRAQFNVAGTGDADSFRYMKSVIRYGRGQEGKAQLLRTYVGGGAQLEPDPTLQGIDLVLITGADFEGIRPPAAAGQPTTTSTTQPGGPPRPKGAPPLPQC